MENFASILVKFLDAVALDPRIGASHVSLFCALLQQAIKSENPSIHFRSGEIMKAAKISGSETYHKRIRELNDYGYISYIPSFNHRRKNKVCLKSS